MPLRTAISLAWRNLWRNTHRTLITFAMMSLGLGLLIFSSNFAEGAYNDMIATGVSSISGHVVLQDPHYKDNPSLVHFLASETDLTEAVNEMDRSIIVCPRIELQALLGSARGSAAVQIFGVDPLAEARVTRLQHQIIEGRPLTQDEPAVLLGSELAAILDVVPGEKVVATVQGEDELVSQLLRVAGIFRTGATDLDSSVAHINLKTAQEMIGKPDAVSALTLHLRDPTEAAEVAATVRNQVNHRAVEVLTWKEALPALRGYIEVDRAGNYLFLSIIGLLVAIGILNTMFMALHERRHELGLLLALGTPPRVLVGLTLLETLLLALLSSAAGVSLGLLATWPVAHWGIDFSSLYGESLSLAGLHLDTRIFAEVRWLPSTLFALVTIVIAMAAGTWPALRCTSLDPIIAMHED